MGLATSRGASIQCVIGSQPGAWNQLEQKSGAPGAAGPVVFRKGPDDTWPVGDRYAELYSLSVAPDKRGQGIGTALFEAVERELASHGIADLAVAVMAGNTSAMRYLLLAVLAPQSIFSETPGPDCSWHARPFSSPFVSERRGAWRIDGFW